MAALCRFPPPPHPRALSKLFSQSKPQTFPLNFPIRNPYPNPSPNFARVSLKFQRFSSSVSSSSMFESDSPSLGDITRPDFPILHQIVEWTPTVDGRKLVYLDNAATSQKPHSVLKVLNESYNLDVPNGIDNLSAKATDAYELAREKVAAFVNALESREIVFTRNGTEAINLVAYSWGLSNLSSGDEILLTVAEHHSNIVPWQLVTLKTGATLKYVNLTEEGVPDIEQLKQLLSAKTKLVVTHHVSNVLGSVMPIDEIVAWSHDVGAKVLVDACQSVPHMVVDVQKLDADFLVASSHKMCGPTGIRFLYGKSKILSTLASLDGVEMISDAFQVNSLSAETPSRLSNLNILCAFTGIFETGTPAIAQAIGFGAAIDYLSSIGMQRIQDYEEELGNNLYHRLLSVPNVRIYGPAPSEAIHRAALCSFNVENIHPTDIATILDEPHGVAIRSGHHCAQPLHHYLGINASARASLYFYNTKEEVDFFIEALKKTISFFNAHL